MGKVMGAFEDLLPMTTNPEVQGELLKAREGTVEQPGDLAFNRISGLTQEVLLFAAGFDNSGITAITINGGWAA